jgi:hypothetical protein
VSGNVTPYAEFNMYVDPEAADIVIGSGLPVTMCGLNVTHRALATGDVVHRIAALGTPLARICVDLLTFFSASYRRVFGFEAPPCTTRSRSLASSTPRSSPPSRRTSRSNSPGPTPGALPSSTCTR